MMKSLILSASLVLLPALTMAQASKSEPAAKTSSKQAASKAKPSAKAKSAAPGKAAKKTVAKQDPDATSSRTRLRSGASQVASGIRASEAALTPDELAIAQRVYVGDMPCELGASVNVASDPQAPGRFEITGKGFKYRMHPVATSTGAIRLEDSQGDAIWLQIGNKSMLMDQKRGQRLADECKSPAQVAVAEALLKAPARSFMDEPAK